MRDWGTARKMGLTNRESYLKSAPPKNELVAIAMCGAKGI